MMVISLVDLIDTPAPSAFSNLNISTPTNPQMTQFLAVMLKRASSMWITNTMSRILIIYSGGTIGMVKCPKTKGWSTCLLTS